MLLQSLQPEHARMTSKRRVGRGGKRGSTSGRGQKGQKSRSGHRIRPAERDLILRLPKLRGYNNKPLSAPTYVIHIRDLVRLPSTTVTLKSLHAAGLIPSRILCAKILGNAMVERAYIVSGIFVSQGAKDVIEKAGGRVTTDQ